MDLAETKGKEQSACQRGKAWRISTYAEIIYSIPGLSVGDSERLPPVREVNQEGAILNSYGPQWPILCTPWNFVFWRLVPFRPTEGKCPMQASSRLTCATKR